MHRTQVATGLLISAWPLAVAVAAPISGRLAERYPAGLLGSFGLAVLAAGLFLLADLPANAATGAIIWRMAVCGWGFGFFQSPIIRPCSVPLPRTGQGRLADCSPRPG
jgi:DHA2 family multidrug resistance protein-like MFS transporter